VYLIYALTPAQVTTSDSSKPESTRSVALLGTAGPLLRLINAARLFPQGPSSELPRHRAAACRTELQLHRLRMELIGENTETDRRDAERDRTLS